MAQRHLATGLILIAAVCALVASPLLAQIGGVFRPGEGDRPASRPATKPIGGDEEKPTPTTVPAEAKEKIDEAKFNKADVVLRVSTEGGKAWLQSYAKATFKVLAVYKESKHEIGTGKLAKHGEFWMAYIVRKTDKPLPAGEMTLYLRLKAEFMQAGMGPVRKTYSPEFLDNTPEKGYSHLKAPGTTSEPASKPASDPAKN